MSIAPTDDMSVRSQIETALWDSLEGTTYDLAALRARYTADANLSDDLGIDSLDRITFLAHLADVFGVAFTQEEAVVADSVSAIETLLIGRGQR